MSPPRMAGSALARDPLYRRDGAADRPFGADPFLTGFRRYEVSAVQLDLIVNRAGWHDPQARINVLTAGSDFYKSGGGLISPRISDRDEPFFFRALSGECIEFRHTNELPKELELDDFQVRTPTDTVGQHIHLVKFDVMAADGSANGFNYEDGTFAPDELMARRYAADDIRYLAGRAAPLSENGDTDRAVFCDGHEPRPAAKDIWRRALGETLYLPGREETVKARDLLQTTVQRWFADPVLSPDGTGGVTDRTLRTVFTHDHFGASSIQQHGFYSALLIEPGLVVDDSAAAQTPQAGDPASPSPAPRLARVNLMICPQEKAGHTASASEGCSDVLPQAEARDGQAPAKAVPLALDHVAFGTQAWVGARKRIRNRYNEGKTDAEQDPFHPDAREFALAIADFALLYDPRDRRSVRDLDTVSLGLGPDGLPGEDDTRVVSGGMERLLCDLKFRLSPYALNVKCGADFHRERGSWFPGGVADWTPAWVADGRNRDDVHAARSQGRLILPGEYGALREHLVAYRQKAAGKYGQGHAETRLTMARPVAEPARPESISVDHHDPYLVNYRMAALPLRIGDKAKGRDEPSPDCRLLEISAQGWRGGAPDSEVVRALQRGDFGECSMNYQLRGDRGDLGEVFNSYLHGDPETPLLEAYQGERLISRLIQGAQEVQHSFQIVGQPFPRNVDQAFPTGMLPLSTSFGERHPLRRRCFEDAAGGRPGEYRLWSDKGTGAFADPATRAFWEKHGKTIAECDNIEGFTFAQEIGISEHFEMRGSLRSDVGASPERLAPPDAPVQLNVSEHGMPETSADYLYSFGTVDAIWNGAWGLARIYESPDAADPATVGFDFDLPREEWAEKWIDEGTRRIGDRLTEPMLPQPEGFDPGEAARAAPNGVLTCPLPGGGQPVIVRRALIAAVEARRVWGERSADYGGTRFDPDGLVLALLDPADVTLLDGAFGTEAGWMRRVGDGFPPITTAAVHDAVKTAYPDGPQPLVLRANAGDCIEVRLLNALEPESQGGLRDLLGDAWLPPITGLNADPQPVGLKHGRATPISRRCAIRGPRTAACGPLPASPSPSAFRAAS